MYVVVLGLGGRQSDINVGCLSSVHFYFLRWSLSLSPKFMNLARLANK